MLSQSRYDLLDGMKGKSCRYYRITFAHWCIPKFDLIEVPAIVSAPARTPGDQVVVIPSPSPNLIPSASPSRSMHPERADGLLHPERADNLIIIIDIRHKYYPARTPGNQYVVALIGVP